MSCVHYKFSSKMSYDTVTFNGLHISLCDLKRQIMSREKLKVANCDLQITNAQTKEEYADDNALIPRNSSVIVRRIPVGGVKATSKTYVISRSEPVSATSKAIDDSSAPISLAQLIQVYLYSRQELKGKKCLDKNVEPVPRIKKSTGIPRSFMIEVEDPTTKGAMLTSTGKYAIPTISAEAYARGKKEKPPFLAEEPSSSSSSDDPVPEELLCLLCKDLMTDAVVIPCCGNSYCDECIRTALLDSEEHTCPTCHQTDVSPDALIANKALRKAVDNFRNGTGYTKRLRKQLQQQQQQQPPLLQPPAPLMTAVRPAALVTAGELYISSSGSISSVLEDKGIQGKAEQFTQSVADQAGNCESSNRGCPRSEHTQRPQAPTLASTAAFVPVPPPPLSPPPPHALPLPPGVPAPQFPPQFAPGQPPSAGYTVPPPAYPPAPAHTSSAWVPTAVPMAHSHTIPTTHAPPLCRQEFYREQRRLEEEKEGKRNSKPDEFTADFAKEMTECKRMKKEHRRSFSSDIVKFGILCEQMVSKFAICDEIEGSLETLYP
ncbi:LOW QUALITY PROTEIN: E3 ubiquitin-protein ligase RBBP6-like [Mycteria americana]|uniref:LOW QUALITY PROTEIN: E3 ubiquitin-protein ligase RBBP6-like n=1 Tax=Mycteria americana TaxID=33587 RepID=UPI003F58BBAC